MRATQRFIAPLAAAVAAFSLLHLPASASAQSATSSSPEVDTLLNQVIPGQSLTDHLGRPNQELLNQARDFATQPFIPTELRNAILSAVAFYEGTGEPGVALVTDGPTISQFYWPTVSGGCIANGTGDSVGTAIAVPGPTEIPAPGAGVGQTVFLFTALGTTPAATEQGELTVQWINLATLRSGSTSLDNHGINPDGPATVSGVADTGTGTVIALLSGNIHTQDASCHFLPTAAIFSVR